LEKAGDGQSPAKGGFMLHKRSFRALYAFALVASLVFSVIRMTEAQGLSQQPEPKSPHKNHQQIRAQEDADASLPKSGAELVRSCVTAVDENKDSGGHIEPMTASLRPMILHKERAEYTLEAHKYNVQGEVVLSAVFASDGRITDIRVVCGLPHGLTEKAIAAAKKIRFEPAVKNGAPVSVRAKLKYTFRIL
jgi:TonB family protein